MFSGLFNRDNPKTTKTLKSLKIHPTTTKTTTRSKSKFGHYTSVYKKKLSV
jgi:hypothetical protein